MKLSNYCKDAESHKDVPFWVKNEKFNVTGIFLPLNSPISTQLTIRYVQEHAYQTHMHSVDELKQRLIQFWCNLDQNIINNATDQWCKDFEHEFM